MTLKYRKKLVEELDVGGVIDGDDEDTDVLEGDDEGAILVDSLDGALDSLEVTADEADATALLAIEGFVVRQESATVLVVGDLHGLHKLTHVGLIDGDDGGGLVGGAGLEGHILHGGTVGIEHLQLREGVDAGIDKDHIMDGRFQTLHNLLVLALDHLTHGDIVLYLLIVEGLLHGQLATIGHVHGIPKDLVSFQLRE